MGLYQQLPDEITEVDVIVAGGGTAGCIVASRIAAADPGLSVLVIEGGRNNYQDPAIVNIGLFFGHLMPDSKATLFYQSRPSEHLDGRASNIATGGVLGGGSSMNMCMYSRAQRSDFDAWNTPGWSVDEMLPFMKKLEKYHGGGDRDVHGYDGPVQISSGSWRCEKSQEDFLAAAQSAGWAQTDDLQNMDAVNAFARAWRYVSPEGIRQDTAHTYLHPLLQDGKHPNLHVIVESQVARVLVENGRAVGVVFRPNPMFQPDNKDERAVHARRLVVISCGALGTPGVLERSGIGRPEVLSRAGVPLVAENAGVGEGYEDHQLMGYGYKTSLDMDETLNGLLFGQMLPEDMLKDKSPFLGYNAQDASGKIRPTDEEAAALGPAFKEAWDAHFKDIPNKPLCAMALVNGIPGVPGDIPPGAYLGLTAFSLYPFSRGSVHITGPSLDDPVDFDTGFLADPEGIDIKKHVWAYKKQREIMRRMQCYRGEVPSWHPPFAADSPAAIVETSAPLPADVADIVYSADDEKVLERHIRQRADTTWHSAGTCKMKPRGEGGALDETLSVYGVEGLKVADLSMVPGNVGANTNNTALAIGERAADIFIRELGLSDK